MHTARFGRPLHVSLLHILLMTICAGLVSHAAAAEFDFQSGGIGQEEEFLKVDEAFVLSASLTDDGDLSTHWDMPDGYYLYRHQFAFVSQDPQVVSLGAPEIPAGKPKVDDWFGDVEVYYHEADAIVPVTVRTAGPVDLAVTYQGCADAGLCYPPETKSFTYSNGTLMPVLDAQASPGQPLAGVQNGTQAPPDGGAAGGSGGPNTEEQLLAGVLASDSLLYALALFFVAGIGLAFTPCVLPMVPILSSIIVGEGEDISQRRAFTLSLAYVLGMAATYALVGTLVGLFGAELNLQAALQSTPVLVFFALVFVALSLAMFGFYELQLPQSWQNRLNALGQRQQGGKHASVVVMGALSSLVVSPCVSAPLAGALIYISTTNDAVLGGTALLALGLGMGVPLLAVGASGGQWLPRAGAWMNNVKAVFGVLLLAVAVWLLERVVPAAMTLALWAALLMGSGVYLGVLDFSPRNGFAQLGKAAGAMGFLWGVLLLVGAASGAQDPLRPLAPLVSTGSAGGDLASRHAEPQWQPVKGLTQVQRLIDNSDRLVILDLYADWCISCKTMERNVFPAPEVARRLSQFTLLRADVTANDAVDRALLDHYGLFGPPSLVFFGDDGSEIADFRIQGEIGAASFADHLGTVLSRYEPDSEGKVGQIAANSR